MSALTDRLAEACERAADELLDARQFDEYTHAPYGGNAILEADAATLRALAAALRGARQTRDNTLGYSPNEYEIILPDA